MQIPAPRLAAKMSKKEAWSLHLPGTKAPAVQLTDQEQVFLARYSEHDQRQLALEQAGLASPFTTPETAQADLAKANAILAKISRLFRTFGEAGLRVTSGIYTCDALLYRILPTYSQNSHRRPAWHVWPAVCPGSRRRSLSFYPLS